MSQSEHLLSDKQLLYVFDRTKTATAIHVGENATIQTANDTMLQIWGKDKSVIGKSLEDALPELKGQPFIEMFRRVWLEGLVIAGTDTPADLIIDGELKTFYFDFEYRAVKDDEGKTLCVLHTATDITERFLNREALFRAKEREEALAREQSLNEELAASNEELAAVNDQLQQTQESLHRLNAELEQRVANRVLALSESEARFRTMAEATNVLIAVGDETSNATYFNKAWTDITGRSIKELLEFGWVDLVHPEDKDRYVNIYLDAFKDQETFTGEFRVLSKEGDYRWLLAHGPPRFRPDGSFAGYISSCIDITDRKRYEEELQAINEEMTAANEELAASNEEITSVNEEMVSTNEELMQTQESLQNMVIELAESEERFRNLVLLAPIGICMIKGDPFHVEVVNESFLKIIRRKRSDFDEQSYWGAIPEAAAFYEPITRRVVETGETYYANGHEIILMRDGVEETLYVDFVYEPIRNVDGSMDTILIVANEVTEQVLARKKAEQAEENLRMATEAAELGTWLVDAATRDFVFSPRLKEIFGYAPDEDLPYATAVNQIHPEYLQMVDDTIESAITNGTPVNMEYPLISNADGKIRWVRSVGKLIRNRDGEGDYITGVVHDITEQKQDEIRKNDFIGMVSHELKTPLTTLTAIVQVANLKTRNSDDKFLAGAMDKANIQVKKMGAMINGFLNISRLESGKMLIQKQKFELDKLIHEVIDEVKLTVATHTFILNCHETLSVTADRDKIGSVITNLLSNAVKYSPKGNLVEIGCQQADGHIRISVKDEGLGIRQQDLERLFDRYYRVEGDHTQHISGFGIGLYLSAEIIKRHEGKIWAESEPGEGSIFYFTIPVV